MNVKFKKFLTTYVINESLPYPEIKGTICGETKLQDIYNFLQSEIQSPNNKKWPSYIEEAIKHNKQLESKENEKKQINQKKNLINWGDLKENQKKRKKII